MSYCFNPTCPTPDDVLNEHENICRHCGEELLLQNRYRGVKLLGKGGFGQAIEIDDSGTRKVLKILHDDYSKSISLFKREAKVLQRLRHQGIPRVEADGYFTFIPKGCIKPVHCLVMEKIDGLTLKEWLEHRNNKSIAPEVARDWLKQLVEILAKLHKEGFFHRDIKPDNIMLRQDGQLVLIDFGAVREITNTYLSKVAGRQEVTGIGTLGYRAPEQLDGTAVPQSDFFALGNTFVYLLTGKPPDDFPKNPDTQQLIWRDNAPQVSPAFADVIDDLMAWLPGQRPANAQVILQRLASGEGNRYKLEPQRHKEHKGLFRLLNSVKVKYAALLLLGLVGGAKLLSPQIAIALNDRGYQDYEQNRPDSAQAYFKSATILDTKLAEAHYYLGVINEERQQIDGAVDKYRAAIAAQHNFYRAYNNLGRLYILNNNYAAAVSILMKGVEVTQDESEKAHLFKNLGWALLGQQNYAGARVYLNKTIELDNSRPSPHCLLAQVLERQGNPKQALEEWKICYKYGKVEKNLPEVNNWLILARQRLAVEKVKQ
jgi:serine/threonine protein kinase